MVIMAAPLEPQRATLVTSGPQLQRAAEGLPRRVSLSEATSSGSGVSVFDLTGEPDPVEFDATSSFLDYLGKGNRILFRLRDLSQLGAVAQLAYEHTLSFEFDRTREGVSILIFKRGIRSVGGVTADGGTGI